MRPIFAAVIVALLAPALPGSAAESQSRIYPEAADIPVADWVAMAMGRTLTYRINGEFWALEHYYPGTDRVTLQLNDGTCLQGTWDYTAPIYCFHWEEEGTACFRHAKRGDEVLIIETRDGQDTPAVQTMTGVTDAPLHCGPAVTS
jgi:hypothetical protein